MSELLEEKRLDFTNAPNFVAALAKLSEKSTEHLYDAKIREYVLADLSDEETGGKILRGGHAEVCFDGLSFHDGDAYGDRDKRIQGSEELPYYETARKYFEGLGFRIEITFKRRHGTGGRGDSCRYPGDYICWKISKAE